jgi:hypothetical protein
MIILDDTPNIWATFAEFVPKLNVGKYSHDVRYVSGYFHRLLKKRRSPFVVCVEEPDPIRTAGAYPSISGSTGAVAFRPQDTKSRIRYLLDTIGTSVGGSVIDNEQFQIAVRLGQYGIDCSKYVISLVIQRDDDGYGRIHWVILMFAVEDETSHA